MDNLKRIHYVLLTKSFTSEMETIHVICLEIHNWNQLNMTLYSIMNNLVLYLHKL